MGRFCSGVGVSEQVFSSREERTNTIPGYSIFRTRILEFDNNKYNNTGAIWRKTTQAQIIKSLLGDVWSCTVYAQA